MNPLCIHFLHKEQATEVFQRHGSNFTDIIYPICKTKKNITAFDWLDMVSLKECQGSLTVASLFGRFLPRGCNFNAQPGIKF